MWSSLAVFRFAFIVARWHDMKEETVQRKTQETAVSGGAEAIIAHSFHHVKNKHRSAKSEVQSFCKNNGNKSFFVKIFVI